MKKILLFVWLFVFVVGCEKEQFKGITTEASLFIVANQKDGSLSFVDRDTRKLLASWSLNKALMGTALLPDGDTFLLYGKDLDTVSFYSIRTGTKVGEWKTGQGVTNALVSQTGLLLLSNGQTNSIHLYKRDGTEAGVIPVGKRPMTMLEHNKKVYVLNFSDATLSVLDLQQKKVTDTISVPSSSIGAAVYGNELWIGGHGSGTVINNAVHIYENGALKQTVDTPTMPVSFAVDEKHVYVLSHGSSTLRKIDGSSHEELGAVTVGVNPFSVQISGDELFVASYDSDELYVVHADTMKVETTISVGRGPFQITERRGKRE